MDHSIFAIPKGTQKTAVLNTFFTPVFTGKTKVQESQVPETSGEVWSKEDFPLTLEEDHVTELLNQLDLHKPMGPDGIQPQLLRKLAVVVAKPLLTVFERSWQSGEVPENSKKENVTALSRGCLD